MFKLGIFCCWKRKKKPKKANEGTEEIVAQFEEYLDGILEKKLSSLVEKTVEKTLEKLEKQQPEPTNKHNPFSV